jgi:hypothetical protein
MCAGFQRVFEENGGKIIQKLWPELDWISAARFHPANLFLGAIAVDVLLLLAGISPNIMVVIGPLTIAHSAFVHANLSERAVQAITLLRPNATDVGGTPYGSYDFGGAALRRDALILFDFLRQSPTDYKATHKRLANSGDPPQRCLAVRFYHPALRQYRRAVFSALACLPLTGRTSRSLGFFLRCLFAGN